MRILIIEDDRDLAASLADFLLALGHQSSHAADGISGLKLARDGRPDAIILDRMLPKLDGTELCRRLRQEGLRIPVLMLTAMDSVAEKVAGFEAGADDYLAKPFALAELKARLEALHRRAGRPDRVLRMGDLTYDLASLEAQRAGKTLPLNPTTRKLLELLMRESPAVVSREALERALWGQDVPEDDVLRIHIHALRSALDKPFRKKLLHTVHGAGYRLSHET